MRISHSYPWVNFQPEWSFFFANNWQDIIMWYVIRPTAKTAPELSEQLGMPHDSGMPECIGCRAAPGAGLAGGGGGRYQSRATPGTDTHGCCGLRVPRAGAVEAAPSATVLQSVRRADTIETDVSRSAQPEPARWGHTQDNIPFQTLRHRDPGYLCIRFRSRQCKSLLGKFMEII